MILGWYFRTLQIFAVCVFITLPLFPTSIKGTIYPWYKIHITIFTIALLLKTSKDRKNLPAKTLEELREASTEFDGEELQKFTVTTRDGVKLACWKLGHGPKIILCGNGLGCSAVMAAPTMKSLEGLEINEAATIITWDYRGLFSSAPGTDNLRSPQFSIRDSTDDAIEILDHLGEDSCFAFIGYSTGVQVGLELASRYPEKVGRLVLVNGAHGQLLHSLLQPIFRIPTLGDFWHRLLILLRQYESYWFHVRKFILMFARLASTFVIKPFCVLIGRDYELFAFNYFVDFFSYGKTHSCNYLKYPHALDAHSSFHVLHEIEHKTLIIAGMLDVLTPAYHSYEMRARMPNSELLVKTFGTHFTCLEYPEEIGERLVKFLKHKSIDKGKKRGKSRSKSRGRGRKGKDTKKRN